MGLLASSACKRAAVSGGGRRVVSLSPSTTETVFALGAGAELVARSRQCDFPPEAARLPAVGGYADPNVEAIIALAPTLVVGARGPAGPVLEAALRGKGIATFFPETESLAQIQA
ncbi:MAG: helical backbone metal receptor, partial [Polyangiaceae bacterium]